MERFDFIVVGAGVAGLSAGMYAGRLGLRTLVLGKNSESEEAIGGVITLTDTVENYPGFLHLTGTELAKKIYDHAMDYKEFVTISQEKVESVVKAPDPDGPGGVDSCFLVKSDAGKTYLAKSILLATGTRWRKLPMEGAKEFENKGVSYCALCDGPLYRGKIVGVVGGSDSAAKEALFIAKHAANVYIFIRGDKLRAEPVNLKLVAANSKIHVVTGTNIVRISGARFVEEVTFDREVDGSLTMKIDGIFGAIGHLPLSELAVGLGVELDAQKNIKINREAETNVPGVYAAGDVTDTSFKQAIVGVAEGVIAVHSAFQFVQENEFVWPADDPSYINGNGSSAAK